MCTFFDAAHKEELKKTAQGTHEASHVIHLTSNPQHFEALSVQQNCKINELVDGHQALQVTVSFKTGSIPGTITATDTAATNLAHIKAETTTLHALVARLEAAKTSTTSVSWGTTNMTNHDSER